MQRDKDMSNPSNPSNSLNININPSGKILQFLSDNDIEFIINTIIKYYKDNSLEVEVIKNISFTQLRVICQKCDKPLMITIKSIANGCLQNFVACETCEYFSLTQFNLSMLNKMYGLNLNNNHTYTTKEWLILYITMAGLFNITTIDKLPQRLIESVNANRLINGYNIENLLYLANGNDDSNDNNHDNNHNDNQLDSDNIQQDQITTITKLYSPQEIIEYFGLSEITMVKYLVNHFHDKLKHSGNTNKNGNWYYYDDNGTWIVDHNKVQIACYISQRLDRVLEQISFLPPSNKTRKQVFALSNNLHNDRGITSIARLASRNPSFQLNAQWDAQPGLINCCNGVVDLSKGDVLNHDAKYFMKKQVKAKLLDSKEYDVIKGESKFINFINQIMCEDEKLIAALQRICGYIITGYTNEKKLFFFYSKKKDTGKSTLSELLTGILGDYSLPKIPFNIITESFGAISQSPQYYLAQLEGVRLAVTSEAKKGEILDGSLIKSLTGGSDQISGREPGKSAKTFRATHKVVIFGNHMLSFEADKALIDRLVVIPFNHQFVGSELNKYLLQQILENQTERNIALTWFVEGARLWSEYGLAECSAINNSLNEMLLSMDSVESFLQIINPETERYNSSFYNYPVIITGDSEDKIDCEKLYEIYVRFCKSSDNTMECSARSKKAFYGYIADNTAIEKKRSGKNGNYQYLGIKCK